MKMHPTIPQRKVFPHILQTSSLKKYQKTNKILHCAFLCTAALEFTMRCYAIMIHFTAFNIGISIPAI